MATTKDGIIMGRSVCFVCLLPMALGACATPQAVVFESSSVPSLSGRTAITVEEATPNFMPTRASSSAFGLVGAIAEVAASQTYAEANGILDPAPRIESRVVDAISARHGVIKGSATVADGKDRYDIDATKLYVDAQTTLWGYNYFSFDWGRYQVTYNAVIRLIDGSNRKVVGELTCSKVSHEKSDEAPSLTDLLANESTLMNSLLSGMADSCASDFEAQVLAG